MRVERIQLASLVSEVIEESTFLFFVSYKGLDVANFSDFRRKIRESGSMCRVLKNSYIRLGFSQANMSVPDNWNISGSTSLVYGKGDPCPSAKIIRNFSKDIPSVSFKGGVIENAFLDASDAERIADLPSKEILQSQLIGVLQAPMTNVLQVFNAKILSIVYVLQAYADKKEQSS